ncbi:MAG: hypothetical protein RJA70_414 [Pseudomonadota bacterium]|jgi:hypothetical protein
MTPASTRQRLARATVLWLLGAGGPLLFGCDQKVNSAPISHSEARVKSAQFGVFFGGQIQERTEIPFILEGNKQQLGFRVVFDGALPSAQELHWEFSRPTPRRQGTPAVSTPEGRTAQLSVATLAAGETRFEHLLTFVPGDPLGLWNLRVVLGTDVVIDRPFLVYDPAARELARRSKLLPDAGL